MGQTYILVDQIRIEDSINTDSTGVIEDGLVGKQRELWMSEILDVVPKRRISRFNFKKSRNVFRRHSGIPVNKNERLWYNIA